MYVLLVVVIQCKLCDLVVGVVVQSIVECGVVVQYYVYVSCCIVDYYVIVQCVGVGVEVDVVGCYVVVIGEYCVVDLQQVFVVVVCGYIVVIDG